MIGCIIQARMGSSRLPGKVLMKVDNDESILSFLIKQLNFCKSKFKIIIATTLLPQDDIIENFALKNDILFFRGDEDNVLDRYYKCAKKFSLNTIIRIPSDKPLIDPIVVDDIIQLFQKNNFDYVTNFLPLTFPAGTEVEIFSFEALEKTWLNATLLSEKEHVTPYMYDKKNNFKIFNVINPVDLSHFRWVVDRIEDYDLVRKIIQGINNRPIVTNQIISFLKNNPKFFQINQGIDYFEGYKKSKLKDT